MRYGLLPTRGLQPVTAFHPPHFKCHGSKDFSYNKTISNQRPTQRDLTPLAVPQNVNGLLMMMWLLSLTRFEKMTSNRLIGLG